MFGLTGMFNDAFIYFAIILIAALSGLVSEKAGIVNIGINGMMIIGALTFKIMGNLFEGQKNFGTIFSVILIACLVSGLFALLHGIATIIFKADHVVSGTAINLLAGGIGLYLTTVLGPKITPEKNPYFGKVYEFSGIGETLITPLSIWYFAISIFVAIVIFIYFKYSKVGLRHSAVGENPNAADTAAINVIKYKWYAVFASGFLAGFAGIVSTLKLGIFIGNVEGLGFIALAIMILGQWRIPFIAISSFLFALIWGYLARNKNLFGMPEYFIKMLPFILSIASLVLLSKYNNSPKAIGEHFDKSKR